MLGASMSQQSCMDRARARRTPNDLLPSRLGRCCYAQGVDGRILGTLANTDVVNVVEIDADWTPRMLLELAAGVNGPCFNAFIDVGAAWIPSARFTGMWRDADVFV